MDGVEDAFDGGGGEAVLPTFFLHGGEDGVPAAGLEDGHVVVPLVSADLAADFHPRMEQVQQVLVQDVDLGAELVDAFAVLPVAGILFADPEGFQKGQKVRRGQLLLRVGQGAGGVAVGFDHQPFQSQVHRLLGYLQQVFPLAAHVGGVGEEGQRGIAGPEFDGDLPAGCVAVGDGLGGGEAPVNHAELPDAGPVEPFQGPDPEIQVRIDRILDEHGDVRIPERVGNLLHQEGVGRGPGPDPEQVDAVFEAFIDVLFAGDLGADLHPGLLLDPPEPLEARRPDAFEAAGMRPGFPDTGAEDMDAARGKFMGRPEHLLLGLGAAGTGDGHGSGQGEEPPLPDGDKV